MQRTPVFSRRAWQRRAMSLLMALVLLLGLVPGLPALEGEASAHWADSYLSQMVEWGFIRPDQAEHPDRALTRADFMAITNRAYGYHETGETPFEDVAEKDWFYDDVGIAYTARYIKGTSPTTASPNNPLTRETAATILGRNMMLQESAGELLDFTDARQISSWAKGTVKSSLEHYLVSGYTDGTFRPKRNVSWGEMAAMVSKLVGTPLQEPGDYALGGTFGNVTITSPGVTLRDTVISGDLYITGGVGLGDVKLENVTVLGRIIASGAGSSEGGGASILLRNVTADELLVDNLQDHPVSVRADGITEIGQTTVRTTAYIEDTTPDGMGLKHISLEGESYPEGEEPEGWEPPVLTLAGRIEEVVNKTPNSTVHAAAGTVAKLTVDEAAENSSVIIDRNTVVKELNLDTATIVTGEGDIGKLVVNAPGCEVEMLPEEIEIRPGITAIIAGEEMDSVAAKESSMDPMILAGYPEARDIIPTGLDAVFSTNKAGTIYWAVSAITDGSIGEEDLIKPPSYGSRAVANGSLKIAKGNEETTAKVGGLTPGGSYYLSAVLVDARDKRSTTKVISFTTPDNTTPAFCAGYPYMSKVSRTDSVVVVMPNKSCKLYYALLPQGATAPTENELKTASVAGALGYGVRDVSKNVEDVFRVNDVILDEQETYVLYLWLVDADGVNKGAITPLTFTTDDDTPPEFIVDPTVNKVQATSVGLTFRLNEDGTVYWVAVPAGTLYPKPEPGTDYETAPLNSDFAKLQVSSGMNIGADGKAGKVAAKANADGTINVTGLKPETTYDFYYVAKDNAGPDRNYSVTVKKITINTLDTSGPKVTQSFSKTSGTDKTIDPMSNTDIYLDISENVRYTGQNGGKGFLELYQDVKNSAGDAKTRAINLLAANLFGSIKLHKISLQDNSEETILETHNTNTPFTEDMTIDYTQATVEARSTGGIRITFPAKGLHLENGGQYYFTIGELTDTSNNQNEITPDPVDFWSNEVSSKAAGHNVPPFVVEFAAVNLSSPGVGAGDGPVARKADGTMESTTVDGKTEYTYSRIDMSFRMTPTSTSSVSDTISYDVLLWSDSIVTYKLYYRVLDETGKPSTFKDNGDGTGTYLDHTPLNSDTALEPSDYLLPQQKGAKGNSTPDKNGWIYLGESGDVNPSKGSWSGKSVNKWFNNCGSTSFPQLNNLSDRLRYEFVITLDTYKGNDKFSTWNGEVKFHVNVAAGQSNNLDNLAGQLTTDNWERFKKMGMSGGARSIGRWNNAENQLVDTQELVRFFTDSSLPRFMNNAPSFTGITATSVTMNLALETPGTVYYVIGKASNGQTGLPEITTTRYILSEDNGTGTVPTGKLPGADGTVITPVGTGQMYVTLDGPHAPTDGGTASSKDMPNWMKGTGNVPPTATTQPDDDTADDPGKSNMLLAPTSLNIFSPESWESGANAIAGSVRSEAFRAEPKVVDGLEPNTDYFAYFVIKGEADDLSHVYVYHFKTDKSAKPKINLRPQTDGSVDLWTDISATMSYVVFSRADAWQIDILKQPFTKAAGTVDSVGDFFDKSMDLPDYWDGTGGTNKWSAPNDERPATVTGFTVLDALMTTYSNAAAMRSSNAANGKANTDGNAYVPLGPNGNISRYEEGYSVFDIYASTDIRQKVDALIRTFANSNNKTVMGYGDGLPSPGGGEPGKINIELPRIEAGTPYVILTAGQSTVLGADDDKLDYLRDSFKANEEVLKTAGEAPNLTRAEGGYIKDNKDGTYTISVMLLFDKLLYDTEGKQITTDAFKDALVASPPIGTGATDPKPTVTSPSSNASAFTLSYSAMEDGGSFAILGYSQTIWNASHVPADEDLLISLKIEERVTETAKEKWGILTVEWGVEGKDKDWYARSFEVRLESTPIPQPTPDPGTGTNLNDIRATGFVLSRTSGAELKSGYGRYSLTLNGTKGMSSTVTAELTPAGATDKVTWASSNPNVASLSGGTGRTVTITGKAAGSATITVTVGTMTKQITVTVEPTISVASFKPKSTADTIAKTADGYTWTRPDGSGRREATLTFTTNLSMKDTSPTVDPSDKKAVEANNLVISQDGKSATVNLSFIGMNRGEQVTVTITVGAVSQKFVLKLAGKDTVGPNINVANRNG